MAARSPMAVSPLMRRPRRRRRQMDKVRRRLQMDKTRRRRQIRRRRNRMKSRAVRLGLVLAAVSLLLGGCSVFDEVGSWFASNGKKSNLRGVRIPVMSLDADLKADPTIAGTQVVLPPPHTNPEWPQPGGYASNAMYHLAVPGRLREVWSQDAGKGNDIDSHLTSAPVVAAGLIYVQDFEAHVFAFRAGDGHPVWDRSLAPRNGT